MAGGPFQDFSSQGSVCTGITDDPCGQSGKLAVFITPQGILHMKGVAFGMHADGFGAVQADLDRSLQMETENSRMSLNAQIFFAAECPAGGHQLDADFIDGNTEDADDLPLILIHSLALNV